MKLLVIRHGESEADILRVCEGRADFPLTERGHRQAAAMAEYVAVNYPLDRIYCSTLTRARQTAQYLSDATGCPLTAEPLLMEFNNGLIAGLPYAEAHKKYPPVPDLPLHKAVYGQESKLEFRFRAEAVLSEILSANAPDATVAVVTHGGMINQLYRAFLRLPVDADAAFSTGDTGIHLWQTDGPARRVTFANATAHAAGI